MNRDLWPLWNTPGCETTSRWKALNRRVSGSPAGRSDPLNLANMRAFEAMKRTAVMRIHAASAHDRAAQLHELLADAGQGDVHEHQERAALHRRQAHEDRAVAARMFRSKHLEPPETGHS